MSANHREDGKTLKKRKIKQRPALEQVPAPQQQQQQQQQQQTDDGNSRFARALGSTDYGTRENGLQALSRFLVYKGSMPELDMMKLWKGLFFCFWHSDKVPVQTELAERLAGLLQQMKPAMAQLYWAGLLATLRREWFAMDHHRINKFLMLVRKFVAALLARLQATHWDVDAISRLTMQLPLQQTLIPTSNCKSLGLSYHLADVWLDELKNVADEQAVPQQALLLLLEPFFAVLESSGEQPLLARIKESVFDVLVSDLAAAATAAATAGEEEEQQEWMYCSQLNTTQLASRLFERGAAEGVKARNRQALYSISKELERLAGKRRKLGTAAAAEDGQQQPRQQQQHQPQQEAKVKTPNNVQQPETQQQQQQQQGQQEEQQQEKQQPQLEAVLDKKKKKHHRHNQQDLQAAKPGQQQRQQQQPVANGMTPSSSKKHKRLAEQQQGQEAAATTSAPGAAAPPSQATPKSGKKKRKHSEASAAGTPAAATAAVAPAATPKGGSARAAARAAAAAAAAASAEKKGVKIDLRRNVYFAHGAPVPPEDVRSPPSTKPKGSALKTSSRLAREGGSPAVPATAPAKQQQRSKLQQWQGQAGSGRKAVTPNSVPRVKAAAFF